MFTYTAHLSSNKTSHAGLRALERRDVFRRGLSRPAPPAASLSAEHTSRRKGWARLLSHLLQNRRGFRVGVKSLGRAASNWRA